MKESIELQNERLKMRTLTPAEADLVLEWATDTEVVKNFSFFQKPATRERILDYINEKYESPADLLFAIFTSDGDYIGNAGLHEIDRVNDTARIGIIIGKREFWNRGYAHEALKLLLNYAFTEGLIHKVYVNFFSTNTRTLKICEKLGFQREGLLRGEYKIHGHYQDLLRMGILAEDFLPSKEPAVT
jgi:RimJ/RimL family protein N-acetyltransferase